MTVGNSLRALQKAQHRITTWPRNSTPRYISKRTETGIQNKNMYMHIYSSTIHNSQKVERAQMSIKGGKDKQILYIHTMEHMEYYSTIKRNEILVIVTTWMNVKTLCYVKEAMHKRSHIEWFRLHEISKIYKSIEIKCRLVIARGWGRE